MVPDRVPRRLGARSRSRTSATSTSCRITADFEISLTGRSRPDRDLRGALPLERPVALSDVLPLFENMGVHVADERPYAVRPRDSEGVWIYERLARPR